MSTLDLLKFAAGLLPRQFGNEFDPAGGFAHPATIPSEKSYQAAVSTCAETLHAQVLRYDVVSKLQYADLERFLARAASSGAIVDIFITPFNPAAEEKVTEGTLYPSLRGEVMLRLSKELGRRVHRIYEPAYYSAAPPSLRAGPGAWADCVHYTQANGDIIVREILAPGRN